MRGKWNLAPLGLVFGLTLVWCFKMLCAAENDREKAQSLPHSFLTLAEDHIIKSEVAGFFVDPIKCDADGDIFLMTNTDATSGVHKLNSKGERLANFVASSGTDLSAHGVSYFSVDKDGNVYQIAYLQKPPYRAVLVYNKDGSYKAGIKLDAPPGYPAWAPGQIAVFGSGDFLIAGSKTDPDTLVSVPFTSIFSSNGTLKRELNLSDDADIKKMAESADARVIPPDHSFGNRAVDLGEAETGEDGNVYLMRRLSPAIVYAITPAGEAVRRFIVDPQNTDLIPVAMHVAGSRIAILFRDPQTRKEVLRITDLEGSDIAAYEERMKGTYGELGSAFACYSQNPDRFTFLFTDDNGYLGFHIAEPR